MDIREIEKIIDHMHDNHPVFASAVEQVVYELLSTFQDTCNHISLVGCLNPGAFSLIIEQMDALNTALSWAYRLSGKNRIEYINENISKKRFEECISLLNDYALPYSVLCSGYIAYSRNRLTAEIDGSVVTFTQPEGQNASAWSDILREINGAPSSTELIDRMDQNKILQAVQMLNEQVFIEDGKLCYNTNEEVIEVFKEIATLQWDSSKTLPDSWVFDVFSLEEYKRIWVLIAALCYMHFWAAQRISDPMERLNNALLLLPKESITAFLSQQSGVSEETTKRIIEYITFDYKKTNVDIMYQPIVETTNQRVIITPALIMGSRPERNLLAVVSSNKDTEYSKEVNDLENLMISELEDYISGSNDVKTVKNKKLGGALPDVDFCILDRMTNSALIAELKWFAAADSTREVFAKEDEITHGCEQVEQIMSYAMNNRKEFFKRLFGIEDGGDIDIFCCVVAKHNIRTQNNHVPVIDLKTIGELFSSRSINNVFHIIRNHEYEKPIPSNAKIGFREISYGEYVFRIPAIEIEV